MQPKVQLLMDPEDAWFYSAEWQERHREAIAEVERGEGELHESTEDFLAALMPPWRRRLALWLRGLP